MQERRFRGMRDLCLSQYVGTSHSLLAGPPDEERDLEH